MRNGALFFRYIRSPWEERWLQYGLNTRWNRQHTPNRAPFYMRLIKNPLSELTRFRNLSLKILMTNLPLVQNCDKFPVVGKHLRRTLYKRTLSPSPTFVRVGSVEQGKGDIELRSVITESYYSGQLFRENSNFQTFVSRFFWVVFEIYIAI